jgi:hypothetical protein
MRRRWASPVGRSARTGPRRAGTAPPPSAGHESVLRNCGTLSPPLNYIRPVWCTRLPPGAALKSGVPTDVTDQIPVRGLGFANGGPIDTFGIGRASFHEVNAFSELNPLS